MKTRFEIITAAFPLHAQVIAERVYDYQTKITDGPVMLEWFMTHPAKYASPQYIISTSFVWGLTPEGVEYWARLAGECDF